MCGRFALSTQDLTQLKDRFKFVLDVIDWKARYNIAPAQEILTVVNQDGIRKGIPMVWGLIPHWAKDRKIGYKMINARAETLAEKPSFRKSYKQQRCLIPATGFYEWRRVESKKIPYWIHLKSSAPFAFAGLWDSWLDPNGDEVHSCTIITTEANQLIQPLHERMPVILGPEAEESWLDPNLQSPKILQPLLVPYPSSEMQVDKVSPVVNSWKYDEPDCIDPV